MEPAAPRPGRPRDPDVDARILRAAVEHFGEQGWVGFSIEGVARRAGVGKPSIYRRWDGREALLLAAMREHLDGAGDIEPSAVAEELAALTRQWLAVYLGTGGRAALRLSVDSTTFPEAQALWEEVRRSVVLQARAIVRRAIGRGDLPADTSVTLLLDTLLGGVMNHVVVAPPDHLADLSADPDRYVVPLVDWVLAAARAPR